MANIKSAKLRIKKTKVKTSRNNYWKTKLKDSIKVFEANKTSEKKDESLKQLFSAIDKASSKKVIHKNKAKRMKSRFSKMV